MPKAQITLAKGLGITDIEVGPDGYVHILSLNIRSSHQKNKQL
jgi:hypothetical protein